jgi:hypothetical protein
MSHKSSDILGAALRCNFAFSCSAAGGAYLHDVARTGNTTEFIGQERLLRDDLVEAVLDAAPPRRICESVCYGRSALVLGTIRGRMLVPGERCPCQSGGISSVGWTSKRPSALRLPSQDSHAYTERQEFHQTRNSAQAVSAARVPETHIACIRQLV